MAVEENENKAKNNSQNASKRNSISEPDLATAERDYLKSGFPPGTTVDELWLYRRKKPIGFHYPEDHLKPLEGSFKLLKSEYKRSFINFYDISGGLNELPQKIQSYLPLHQKRPKSSLKLEGEEDFHSVYSESFIEHQIENQKRHKPSVNAPSQIIDLEQIEMEKIPSDNESHLSEVQANYIKYPFCERTKLSKRPTTLKCDGEFYSNTEKSDNFIDYHLNERTQLIRKPTQLKLEGDMDTKSETRDKFIPLDCHQGRPPLCKKITNLHLEGDLIITSEKQEKFIPYEIHRRPPLEKRTSNLHIEGEIELTPSEYRREFIEYKSAERQKLALPHNNLKTDGFYDMSSQGNRPFDRQIHPVIPFLRGAENVNDGFPMPSRPPSSSRTAKSPINVNKTAEDLSNRQTNAYIDFKKDDSSKKGRRALQYSNLKGEGNMDNCPEYKCSYVDFPRERPRLRRPTCSLSSEGDMEVMTEKREKYVAHPNIPRTESLKREPELKLEGRFECQPEYRKAYIDYLIREKVERKPRPLDNLGSEQNRIFEIASSTDQGASQGKLMETCEKPVQKTTNSSTASFPRSPKSKKNSISSLKTSKSLRRMSDIESSLFGPKLTVSNSRRPSSKSTSRSTSPSQIPISSRRTSRSVSKSRATTPITSENNESEQQIKKFSNSIRVENLANKTITPPRPIPLINVTNRSKWMRDSTDRESSSSAFVILDKEINNNEPKYNVKSPRERPSSPWYNLRH